MSKKKGPGCEGCINQGEEGLCDDCIDNDRYMSIYGSFDPCPENLDCEGCINQGEEGLCDDCIDNDCYMSQDDQDFQDWPQFLRIEISGPPKEDENGKAGR